MKKLLIICGPTATGKTALALRLAKQFNGELVSADSRQIYRGMDIGTGKDLPENCEGQQTTFGATFRKKQYLLKAYIPDGIPLWMYDIVDPTSEFSVSHYVHLAHSLISDIWRRGKLPIIVGGTGLYISALLKLPETLDIPPNRILRNKLDLLSLVKLQDELKKIDINTWQHLNNSDRQNPRRLVRKIEIALPQKLKGNLKNGQLLSANILRIGLKAPLPWLYRQIDRRVDKRVSQGLTQEIQELLAHGYNWDLPAFNCPAYKEWKEYFSGTTPKSSREPIIQKWKFDEHGLARRQLTWFQKQARIIWFKANNRELVPKVVKRVGRWYTKA